MLVHEVAAGFGYDYNDATPDWVHPFIHLILILAPALLILVGTYFALRGILKLWRRRRGTKVHPEPIRGLDSSLFSSVLRYSKKQQALMIMLSLIAMPILYLTLELPKQIVNNALDSDRFPVVVLGQNVDQLVFLMLLCGLYLLAILLNGLNKYGLNVFKGYVAERFLRRFRLLVYRQWRSDPDSSDKSEIIPILAQEVEPVGGFAADMLTLPILQGGTLLTILLFMFVQDPVLGAAALTVLPIQLVLLPKLQRKVNALSRTRIKEVRLLGRQLSDHLRDQHSNSIGLLPTSARFRELEHVRRKIFRLKFFIKALNNFLTALTPFLFYSLGGYFVIEGRITLGALVAVLAAHKDFSAPLKELFRYYQTLEDTRIRYKEINGFFANSSQSSGKVQADDSALEKASQSEQSPLRKTTLSFEGPGALATQ
ncbi:ABC transporter, permease protein [Sulfitobacter noctilucicola]|uniref:ABC-type multidrug transport system fused ATPase/permease subunit n=1 Tax=Sulfitobacter noctilucicola TaxID=1342301 RepID=A0A7W6Q5Y9_9RHOB|nr:ABC transporter, permease protein [Sulfitobacter noctilucicola]MBB4175809.1 ABC-type multidrug transport system fused ATPase/permease subunit [Sulfitobacter noctilucicola]